MLKDWLYRDRVYNGEHNGHLRTAVRAFQRIDFLHLADDPGPGLSGDFLLIRHLDDLTRVFWYEKDVLPGLHPKPVQSSSLIVLSPCPVGIDTVVADEMFALWWDLLSKFDNKVDCGKQFEFLPEILAVLGQVQYWEFSGT